MEAHENGALYVRFKVDLPEECQRLALRGQMQEERTQATRMVAGENLLKSSNGVLLRPGICAQAKIRSYANYFNISTL